MDMGKKRHKVIDQERTRAAAGGWYDFTPTASGFFPCGKCGMASATMSKPGGPCLRCRMEQQRPADPSTE
jgi:hypothetical protein